MELSKSNKRLLVAYSKGYRIDIDGFCLNPKGVVLKGQTNNNGYKDFSVRVNGKSTRVTFHRLQAYQKYGDKLFKPEILVRHKNGICHDNSFSNILIGTTHDNAMDIPKELRVIRASNPRHNHQEIISDRNNGLTYEKIMKKHSISSKGTISFIINKSLSA